MSALKTQATLIRPFKAEVDYPALAELVSATTPDYPTTESEIRHRDQSVDPGHLFRRLVAEQDGVMVGSASFGHLTYMFHPRKFFMNGWVHPSIQHQGVGRSLLEAIWETLSPFEPLAVRAWTRVDWPGSMRFLQAAGFQEEFRVWESRLDVNGCDLRPYAGLEERLGAEHGIRLTSLAQLSVDPDHERKLYELDCALAQDIPSPEPETAPSFETWLKSFRGSVNRIPEAYLVALAPDGTYIGSSTLNRSQASADLRNGLTGTLRAYRGKGLALAMKVRNIRWAREHGHAVIRTENHSMNRPMLSINERLGFEKEPAWVYVVWTGPSRESI